jgi:hypothetical protein
LAIFLFEQFLNYVQPRPKFLISFFPQKKFCIILKNGFGYIFGHVLKHSSGHPGRRPPHPPPTPDTSCELLTLSRLESMYYDHRVDINMNEYSWQIFSPRKKEKCFHGFAGEKCAQRDEKEKGEKDFEEKKSQFFFGEKQ